MPSYSTTIINEIYERCSLRPPCAENEGAMFVPSFISGTHVFNKNQLRDIAYIPILNILKRTPLSMRRSVSSEGTPWTYVAKNVQNGYWMSFETADRLVCIGIALGLVSRVPPLCNVVKDVEYIIIEDLRQQKMESINPSCHNNQRRKTWK